MKAPIIIVHLKIKKKRKKDFPNINIHIALIFKLTTIIEKKKRENIQIHRRIS